MCMTTRERESGESARLPSDASTASVSGEASGLCVYLSALTRIPIARVGAGCVNGAADLELRTATVCA